jgi:hypothetical protein
MSADRRRAPHDWLDRDAGPVVRPYALTQGRVAPAGGEIDLLAFVVATVPDQPPLRGMDSPRRPEDQAPAAAWPRGHLVPDHLLPEHRAIVRACWEPVSVVEVAARLDLSLGVVRVLLGDLRSAGLISLYQPPAAEQPHDVDVLKAVVNGLRAL